MFKVFRNFSIGKKLILSFICIAILASISGTASVAIMQHTDKNYSYALINYGFSQGDIGKALSQFCRIDGNVHDAVSYMNTEYQNAARNNITKQSQLMEGHFNAIAPTLDTEESKRHLQTARTAWAQYQQKAAELVNACISSDPELINTIQERMVEELDPIYIELFNALTSLMDEKVSTGDSLNDSLSKFSAVGMASAIAIIIVAFAASIILGYFIARSLSRPIKACSERLLKLSDGNLQEAVPVVDTSDEVGVLANATANIVNSLKTMINDASYLLKEMAKGNFAIKTTAEGSYIGDFKPLLMSMREINVRLSDTLFQINLAAGQVSTGSDQVASGSQALSQGATEQASAVEELAATINDISSQVKENAANAVDASQKANTVGREITASNQHMKEMTGAMSEINQSANEIGKIIKNIEDIAFQTNILALNAAVEAARAGAAGKGFAVVADEVRNLASKSAEASNTTAALIESAIRAVENGTKIADETAKALEHVVHGTNDIVDTIDRIANASMKQSESINQVTQGVDQISSVVQTNSATAEQSAAASQELSGQSQMLKELVSQFTLKESSVQSNGPKPEYTEPPIHKAASFTPIDHSGYSGGNKY